MTEPHYLRFARALAIVGTLGGVGCGTATTSGTDTGTGGVDAATGGTDTGIDAAVATTDGGAAPDAFFDCASCQCSGFGTVDSGLPACEPDHTICCAAVGPLSPPDLAA